MSVKSIGVLMCAAAACLHYKLCRRRARRRRLYESAAPWKKLPKVELHAHINGSIRAETLRELILIATENDEDIYRRQKMIRAVTLKEGDKRSLSECFAIFDIIHSVVVDAATVTRITREVVEDFAADGCVYLELRSTPRRDVMTGREYVDAVLQGLKEGEENARKKYLETGTGTPIVARLLLSINRAKPVEDAEATIDLALELIHDPTCEYVVGVELSGNPFASSFSAFNVALASARDAGVPVSLHAAEVGFQWTWRTPHQRKTAQSGDIQCMCSLGGQRRGGRRNAGIWRAAAGSCIVFVAVTGTSTRSVVRSRPGRFTFPLSVANYFLTISMFC